MSGHASIEVLFILMQVVLAKVLVDGEGILEPHLQHLVGVGRQSGHPSILDQVNEDEFLVGLKVDLVDAGCGQSDG